MDHNQRKDGDDARQRDDRTRPHYHRLSQQKITDRPSSASAGQKFIGKQQNLKELFEKNW